MPAYPLSGELSRRRLGTESGALRREARAISRAGGNPQKFLEAAGQAKLSEGSAISSAAENRAKQEYGIRTQADLAREQSGLVQQMRGGTTGGILRSAASGTNVQESGTNVPGGGTNAPARMTPSEPVGAMQSVAAPPVNQAKADIAEVGLDEAIKRYYQRSADAEKVRSEKSTLAQMEAAGAESSGTPRSSGIPTISAPYQAPAERPELAAALAESAATKERVAARREELKSFVPPARAAAPVDSRSGAERLGAKVGSDLASIPRAVGSVMRAAPGVLSGAMEGLSSKSERRSVDTPSQSTMSRRLRDLAKGFKSGFGQ